MSKMEVAQDRFDDALTALIVQMRELNLDIMTRTPDQDDWDDTLHATAEYLERATSKLQHARRLYKEGS
jgi:hypothetical protein